MSGPLPDPARARVVALVLVPPRTDRAEGDEGGDPGGGGSES